MHEFSLAKSLLKQVEEIAEENQATAVTSVQVEWGPLAGIEPTLLELAFYELVKDTKAECAKLVTNSVPLMANCEKCQLEAEVVNFDFRCPTCKGNRQVTRGGELVLIGVTLKEDIKSTTSTSQTDSRPTSTRPVEPNSV